MALIDCVKWAPQGNMTVYAYRYPETNLSTYTQLIVQESQVALLFSKGQLIGKFGPGKHTLDSENLPVLRRLFGIPFGGKNPFTAEIWFVNKTQTFSIDWSVTNLPIHDPDYNTNLPLVACGRYGLKIKDPEKFLIELVGTRNIFTEKDLTEQSKGTFFVKVKSTIAQYIVSNHIGYKYLAAYLDQISEYVSTQLTPFWDNLGIDLLNFSVATIDIDKSTPEGRRVAEAIAKQTEMSITGRTWQQEQMFQMSNNAIESMNHSNMGGLMGGLMAINMMNGMGGGMGAVGSSMMQPNYNQPSFGGQQMPQDNPQGNPMGGQAAGVREVFCSNCARKFANNQRFCPHCGNEYNPCPRCGSDNDRNAKRCISCGTQLKGDAHSSGAGICHHCGSPLQPGALFCSSCGTKIMDDSTCTRCGAQMKPHEKFCPRCGNKRQ